MKRTRYNGELAGLDLDCSPVSPMWMVESSYVLQSIQKIYDDW